MNQEIRFCSASDDTRLAYAKVGQGPPLVKVGTWMSHLEHDWNSPVWQPWLENWSRFHTFYRYDPRGCGLSDWNISDFSFDTRVQDLASVVDAAELDHFDLFAMSQGGCVSVAYAAKHPERIRRLIIYGGYLQGSLRGNPTPEEVEEAIVALKLLRLSWGSENPAYRQVFTTRLLPEGTPEQLAWFNNLQLISTSPENAVKLKQSFDMVDVRALAKTIRVPTMVFHAQDDAAVTFKRGRDVAAQIPGARFTILDSKNHVLLRTEPAWNDFWGAFYHFLGVGYGSMAETGVEARVWTELSAREREVLRLLAEGQSNLAISKTLVLSEKTIRNYVSRIYEKLQVKSRGEAIVLARKLGLAASR